ncbi:MAG TPA: DUF5666 domain-containing protein [Pseudonocardiaceae bacterium]
MNRWLFGPRCLVVLVGTAFAAALAGCGSAASSTTAPPAADPSAAATAPAGPRGASGTVASVADSSIEVQDPRTGQVTVTFTPSTSFTRMVAATAGDLATGECVIAMGTPPPGAGQTSTDPSSPITAGTVRIDPAGADGSCAAGGPGGMRGRNRPNGAPSPRNRPPGAGTGRGTGAGGARAAAASGKITSVAPSSFVVQNAGSNATRTVTTTGSTTFSKTVTADHSALAVGQCVTAAGPADDTGAVAASAITISQPGPNGCTAGFGGRRGTGQGGGSGQPGDQGTNHA